MLSDYGNYKAYDKVHPVIKDRNLEEGQFIADSELTKNLYNFIGKLPDDYKQKQDVQAIIDEFPVIKRHMTIADYGKQLQKEINDAQKGQ